MAQQLPGSRFFVRLALVYLLDWVVVIGTIAFAGSTSIWVTPNTRPFNPDDPSISFPFQNNEKIPSWLLIFLSIIVPGVAIALLTVTLPSSSQSYVSSLTTLKGWKRRLYCLNTALLGLGLSIATALLITNGLKNLMGRPRPDMLSRCNLDRSKISAYRIGPGNLLDWKICRPVSTGKGSLSAALSESDLRDGFRSFPSGHCSMSFAGLTYFAIFLAEFVFTLPLPTLSRATAPISAPIVGEQPSASPSVSPSDDVTPVPRRRDEREPLLPRFPIMAAILICGVPFMAAMYIASTRFSDYRHHAFDILFGSALGIFSAWLGWRWYGAWACIAEAGGRLYSFARATHGRKGDIINEEKTSESSDDPMLGRAV